MKANVLSAHLAAIALLFASACKSEPKTSPGTSSTAALGAAADCPRGRCCMTASTAPTNVVLDDTTREALVEALNDERHSEALYRAVIAKFGSMRPFSNIVNAEVCHQRQLLGLFSRYGLEVPANPWAETAPAVPDTFYLSLLEAQKAEQANVDMYERLLVDVENEDIRVTFERLRDASRYNHLPAFERRAARLG